MLSRSHEHGTEWLTDGRRLLSRCVTVGALYYSGCAGTEWKGLKSLMFHERILLFLNTTIKFFFVTV